MSSVIMTTLFAMATIDFRGSPCAYACNTGDDGVTTAEIYTSEREAREDRSSLISGMTENGMKYDKGGFPIVRVERHRCGKHFDLTHGIYVEDVLEESGHTVTG